MKLSLLKRLSPLIAGILFGLGLAVSGMLNPKKIVGFLNIFNFWDPSLAFVMLGGVSVSAVGFSVLMKRGKPLFETNFRLPQEVNIDKPLILGSAIFGVGWGLSGLCPGPIVASLLINPSNMVPFFLLFLLGLWTGIKLKKRRFFL